MQQILKKIVVLLTGASICLSSCVTSKIKPLAQVGSGLQTDSLSVKIFLLEREIPQDIEQLGVVSLSINSRPGLNIDQQVKQQLKDDCQRLGANGAYRINDGTYYPMVVSYLVFRYKK
ncbi:hypothetical protein [Spirosoma horti]